jgi:hypothetical protein
MGNFELLYKIFKKIVDEKLNEVIKKGIINFIKNLKNTKKNDEKIIVNYLFKNLLEENFKGELIKKLKDDEKTLDKLINITMYDYYLTPLEGIYINENIAGIIKYLSQKMITNNSDSHAIQKNIEKQDPNLSFQYRQKITRIWLMLDRDDNINTPIKDFFNIKTNDIPLRLFTEVDGTVKFNYENMEIEYQKLIGLGTYSDLKSVYKSNKIFSYEKPIITDILDPYITSTEGKVTIDDYKIFYLFGNYNDEALSELKCKHQNTLLENTKDFISTIVKN